VGGYGGVGCCYGWRVGGHGFVGKLGDGGFVDVGWRSTCLSCVMVDGWFILAIRSRYGRPICYSRSFAIELGYKIPYT